MLSFSCHYRKTKASRKKSKNVSSCKLSRFPTYQANNGFLNNVDEQINTTYMIITKSIRGKQDEIVQKSNVHRQIAT